MERDPSTRVDLDAEGIATTMARSGEPVDSALLRAFVAAFIPIFVAIDAPGILPVYLGLTDGLTPGERNSVAKKAIFAAGIIGFVFLIAGKAIFKFLNITTGDFKIAGGLILLVIALIDLTQNTKRRRVVTADVAIVPLGMPLIVGPGALTALIALTDLHGILPTAAAFATNLVVALLFLLAAPRVISKIGEGGSKAISKVMSLLLAAIAVSMVRTGVFEIIAAAPKG
jgi:multiple antibiotic resistance protein